MGWVTRVAVGIAALGAAAYIAHSCGKTGILEAYYPSFADAKSSGATDRGWIPTFLPEHTKSIHEIHRIEDPRTWCAFEFPPDEYDQLVSHLNKVDSLPPFLLSVESPGVDWWPKPLRGRLALDTLNRSGFSAFSYIEHVTIPAFGDVPTTYLFIVDRSSGRGFFYETTAH